MKNIKITDQESSGIVLTRGGLDVIRERQRQVEKEGFTVMHDLEHQPGELAAAAVCYAGVSAMLLQGIEPCKDTPGSWPWETKWWKPGDTRQNLVKAAALLFAEIDRVDNAEALNAAMPLGG